MTKSTEDLLTLSLQTFKRFLIPIVTDVETLSCNRHTANSRINYETLSYYTSEMLT
jgi:hypothetical protein